MKDWAKENRERDLWLWGGDNAYFFPKDWCDAFCVKAGFDGGPDWKDDEGNPAPELFGYSPISNLPDSEVDQLFVPYEILDTLTEIDERFARRCHPKMAAFLDEINKGSER